MKKKIVCLLLAMMMLVGCISVLSSCKDPETDCTNHVDENGDNKCDVCDEDMTTAANHRHSDGNGDNKCDVCGKDMGGSDEEQLLYPWENTTISFKMTKNTNSDELSACCERYLAGEWEESKFDDLDILISERNTEAEIETKVTVLYSYYDNVYGDDGYQWGNARHHINREIGSGATDIPDMYCNFVYDMVAASLNSNFANLFSTVRGTQFASYEGQEGYPEGGNYFAFVQDDYLEEGEYWPEAENDQGYFYEYMRSTTLSNTKMYILASDYFTDMVRAFFVTPVNVKLLKDHCASIIGDRDGNGTFDLNDFYAAVENNEWTYDLVARCSLAVYKSSNKTSAPSLYDRIGFALPVEGLPASGIIYSTSITVIDRTVNSETGDLEYSYPDENPDLVAMASALENLMNQAGVIAPKSGDADVKEFGTNNKAMLAVRSRFCEDMVLFGGIECVGALEETEYQDLKNGNGFGVVPVPMYKEYDPATDSTTYLTSIHNVGRPGAIAKTTKNFPQCTAFLNYQSTNSELILETFYETRLQYGTGGDRGTVKMLQFIRDNVRSAFDKTTEDAIGVKYNRGDERWHTRLSKDGYKCNIITYYNESISQKQADLANLQASFEDYPN